ncbi:MAG: PsbP-related protein [Candidatus Nitrosocaldaceae archaeon]
MFTISLCDVYAIEYNSYKGIVDGFIIDYPYDWSVQESSVSYSYIKVTFEEMNVGYRSLTMIGVEELNKNFTLSEYKTLILRQHIRGLTNFTIINESNYTLAGNDARLINYKGVDNTIAIKGDIIYTISNKTAYTIISATEESRYDEIKDIFKHMIDSFRIDNSIKPKPISDRYSDDGIELVLPVGWHGLYSDTGDVEIRVAPSIKSDARLHILITNITSLELFNRLEELDNECDIITFNLVNINGSEAIEIEKVCDYRMKTFIFSTDERLIVSEFAAKDDYVKYIKEFNDAIYNSHVNSTISKYLNYTLSKRISVEELKYNITIPTNWNIFERKINNSTIIQITPNGTNITNNYTAIYLIDEIADIDYLLRIYGIEEVCNITNIHYIIYDRYISGYELSCNDLSLQIIYLEGNTLSYISNLHDDIYLTNFDSIIEEMDNKLGYIKRLQAHLDVKEIELDKYKIGITNNTNLKDISIDEDYKMLRLKVSPSDNNIIKIKEDIFKGLQTLTINQNVFEFDSEMEDIFIILYDNDSEITLTATRIVPEFPLPLLITTILTSIILLFRYKWTNL